jgi:hypothetical protein
MLDEAIVPVDDAPVPAAAAVEAVALLEVASDRVEVFV